MSEHKFELGGVYTAKITGAYLVVIGNTEQTVQVRVFNDKTNAYECLYFYPHELETVEQHLTRELREMELRQEMLSSARKRAAQKELEEAPQATNVPDLKVN
jgi:hypothetical protein